MFNIMNSLQTNGENEGTPFEKMDDLMLTEEIESAKQAFYGSDIDNSQAKMVKLASDLSEMNAELAARRGSDPTADQYGKKEERWRQIARLVTQGTDPTEALKSGNATDNIAEDVEQFRIGTPTATFDDVGGYDDLKKKLKNKGIKPAVWRDFFQGELNRSVINGMVFYGPPGTGKTLMARAFAGEFHRAIERGVTVYKVKPNQLKRGIRGESSDLMRSLFSAAIDDQPAVIIFEEIDTLIQDRRTSGIQKMQSDRDLVGSFLEEINEIDAENVICLGTTNRMQDLDEAAVRDQRLEPVEMGLPDIVARRHIFRIHLNSIPKQYVDWKKINLKQLAQMTEGFTGATIEKVVDSAIRRMGIEYKQGSRAQPITTLNDLEIEIRDKNRS